MRSPALPQGVAGLVEDEAKDLEMFCYQPADERRVLANPSGKHHPVRAMQRRRVSGDMPCNAVHKGFIASCARGFSRRFSSVLRSAEIPEIPSKPDSLLTTRSRSERLAGLLGNPRHRAKIHVTTARAHHQPFQRRHPHRGIDAFAITNRANRRAITRGQSLTRCRPAKAREAYAPARQRSGGSAVKL